MLFKSFFTVLVKACYWVSHAPTAHAAAKEAKPWSIRHYITTTSLSNEYAGSLVKDIFMISSISMPIWMPITHEEKLSIVCNCRWASEISEYTKHNFLILATTL